MLQLHYGVLPVVGGLMKSLLIYVTICLLELFSSFKLQLDQYPTDIPEEPLEANASDCLDEHVNKRLSVYTMRS